METINVSTPFHHQIYIGTAAERAALSTSGLQPHSRFIETDTNIQRTWGGSDWDSGAAPVVQAFASGQARNRELAAVSTRESVTWTTGVTEVTITAFQEATGTAELRAALAVCFDAPSNLVADTWLTHADSTAADSNLFVIPVGESRTFYFSGDGITRMDCLRLYGSEAIGVIVEAA